MVRLFALVVAAMLAAPVFAQDKTDVLLGGQVDPPKSMEQRVGRLELLAQRYNGKATEVELASLLRMISKIDRRLSDIESRLDYIEEHAELYEPDEEEWVRDLRDLREEIEDFPLIKELRESIDDDDEKKDKPSKKARKKRKSSSSK